MKKSDIIVIAVCVLLIGGSVFFIWKGLSPKQAKQTKKSVEKIEFTGNIDTDSIEKLKNKKDYGVPDMENIGREDPFAKF